MENIDIIGKVLFVMLFVSSGVGHFKNLSSMVGYAQYKKLPFPKFAVLASGALLIIAPVLFIVGVAEIAMLTALALFLISTSFIFHKYWKETDPSTKMNEQISFNKNISLAGSIIIIISLLQAMQHIPH
jgi:putative oxidoreductase